MELPSNIINAINDYKYASNNYHMEDYKNELLIEMENDFLIDYTNTFSVDKNCFTGSLLDHLERDIRTCADFNISNRQEKKYIEKENKIKYLMELDSNKPYLSLLSKTLKEDHSEDYEHINSSIYKQEEFLESIKRVIASKKEDRNLLKSHAYCQFSGQRFEIGEYVKPICFLKKILIISTIKKSAASVYDVYIEEYEDTKAASEIHLARLKTKFNTLKIQAENKKEENKRKEEAEYQRMIANSKKEREQEQKQQHQENRERKRREEQEQKRRKEERDRQNKQAEDKRKKEQEQRDKIEQEKQQKQKQQQQQNRSYELSQQHIKEEAETNRILLHQQQDHDAYIAQKALELKQEVFLAEEKQKERDEIARDREAQREFELEKMRLQLQMEETKLLREREERQANRSSIDSLRDSLKDD